MWSIPISWKDANAIPIYKTGGRKSATNYRPLSLTSVASKSTERLIRDAITKYVETNQLLMDNQYGFRNKRVIRNYNNLTPCVNTTIYAHHENSVVLV